MTTQNPLFMDTTAQELPGHSLDERINERGRLDAKLLWVNVYLVRLAYGGPEEGGWWYDNYEPVESLHFATEQLARLALVDLALGTGKYSNSDRRDYTSVLGNGKFDLRCEATRRQSVTRTRPHYE